MQAKEQAPATELPKPSIESNEEKAKIENGGQLPAPNPSNKLVDKNIDKEAHGIEEKLKSDNKNDVATSTKAKNDYYLVYGINFVLEKKAKIWFNLIFFKFLLLLVVSLLFSQ